MALRLAGFSQSVAMRLGSSTKNYLLIGVLLIAGWLLTRLSGDLIAGGFAEAGANANTLLVFFEIIVVAVFGFFAYELAKPTVIPSFVLAIFIGMIQHDILMPLIERPSVLTILTTLGAAFILFGGGLDTPFFRFRKLIGPILVLALVGTILTAFAFSGLLQGLAPWFGLAIPLGAVVLLGAALASTDPAAIIPSLKSLVFLNPRVKDIAISESAINDVVGAVLTAAFLTILTTHLADPRSITEIYLHLINAETGLEILKEILVGGVVGVTGFFILDAWSRWKIKLGEGGEADVALFLTVPLFCFLLATSLHGSGFLAVFVAGLLFQLKEHVSHVEHYFAHTIEGFMKPLIFMLLGATVNPAAMMELAAVGIIMGLIFMFLIRPVVILLTVGPFAKSQHQINWRELVFLSFVRETGVIPAVLLMGLQASGIPGADTVVVIGLWVILLTLIIQPPLTPLMARVLGLAKNAPAFPKRRSKGPIAVLCSRGSSFLERMESVVEWADMHSVENITLLHCPEDKYSSRYLRQMQWEAEELFDAISRNRVVDDKEPIHFEFLGCPGTLQDNIEQLIANDDVSIIFVGTRMLDYRIEDVKRLRVPFVFLP